MQTTFSSLGFKYDLDTSFLKSFALDSLYRHIVMVWGYHLQAVMLIVQNAALESVPRKEALFKESTD